MDAREVIAFANAHPVAWLATADGDQPRVRGFAMWFADETGFYFHTGTTKDVCRQMRENPKVELCFFDPGDGQGAGRQLRVAGTVEFLDDAGLRLVSGGTDNHLILIDLSNRGITGLEAEEALGRAGITVNKNTIPNENRSPFVTSGLRIGTPAVTSRGMKESEMRTIGRWIARVLEDITNESVIRQVAGEVTEMASRYPLHPE